MAGRPCNVRELGVGGWNVMRIQVVLAVLVGLAGINEPAFAAERDIADFFGHYGGSALAKTEESNFLGFEARDLDVIIAAADAGFVVSWTTIKRRGPDKEPKRKSRTMFFLPGESPALFRPLAQGDPTTGGAVSWARIEGDTLTVYIMGVSERGIYEIQAYARTLTGDGMTLLFTRVRDGERIRKVSGKLERLEE
jgi:hypothetical protein